MLIDWFTVVAQGINFLILVWLLRAYLFKPALNVIDERQRLIVTQLEEAGKAKTQAEAEKKALEEDRLVLQRSQSVTLDAVRAEANQERERLFGLAEQEASTLRRKRLDDLDCEVKRTVGDLSNRLLTEVLTVSKKALSDLADASLEDKIVDTFIGQWNGRAHNEARGSARPAKASVRSSTELSPGSKAKIEAALGADTVAYQLDPALGGGIEVSMGDVRLGWNLRSYMDGLAGRLSSAASEAEQVAK